MAQYSMSTATVQRSSGSSAVAHAAYVSGAVFMDERTGQESDYTHRGGVEFVAPAIVVPAAEQGTHSAGIERGRLWNMAEAAEKRKDGTPARKVLVALPHELRPEQRQAVVQEYAQWLSDRYGVAVDYAIHAPDKEGDQRNFHAHMILTTRQIRDGKLTDKSHLEWEGKKLKAAGLPSGKAMVHEMRERWEAVHNSALRQHAPEVEPVSCRSLKAQREAKITEADRLTAAERTEEATAARLVALELDRTPQQHVGWQATAMERRGIQTERGDMRRAAQAEHKERLGIVGQARQRIAELIERGKAAAIAAIARVTQRQAVPAPREQHTVAPEIAWMQQHHPHVFDYTPQQAQAFFAAKRAKWQITDADRERPTAEELFERDPNNPKSIEWRRAANTVERVNRATPEFERELALKRSQLGPLAKLAEKIGYAHKTTLPWAQHIYDMWQEKAAAVEVINSIQREWDAPNSPLRQEYEARAAAEAKRLDKVAAEKAAVLKNWGLIESKMMGIVAERTAQRQAESAAKAKNRHKQREQQRSRDWDLGR